MHYYRHLGTQGSIEVDGKPLFNIYSPETLPRLKEFVTRWRELSSKAGLPGLYLVAMTDRSPKGMLSNFDAFSRFGPADYLLAHRPSRSARVLRDILVHASLEWISSRIAAPFGAPARFDYSRVVDWYVESLNETTDREIPCVLAGWDNTPRSGRRGVVFYNFTAENYERLLRKAVSVVQRRSVEHRIVFIKAWNEWAEGNYLEPDRVAGASLLEATQRVLADDGLGN